MGTCQDYILSNQNTAPMKTTYGLFILIIFTIKVCFHISHNISGKLEYISNRLSIFNHVLHLISVYFGLILFFECLFTSECLFLTLYLHTNNSDKDIGFIYSIRSKNQASNLILGNFVVNYLLKFLNFDLMNELSSDLLDEYLHNTNGYLDPIIAMSVKM